MSLKRKIVVSKEEEEKHPKRLKFYIRVPVRHSTLGFWNFMVCYEKANSTQEQKDIIEMLINLTSPYHLFTCLSEKCNEIKRGVFHSLMEVDLFLPMDPFSKKVFKRIKSLGDECSIWTINKAIEKEKKKFFWGNDYNALMTLFISNGESKDHTKYEYKDSSVDHLVNLKGKSLRPIMHNIHQNISAMFLCDCPSHVWYFFPQDKPYEYEMKIIINHFMNWMFKKFSYIIVLYKSLFFWDKWLWNTFRKNRVTVEFFTECTSEVNRDTTWKSDKERCVDIYINQNKLAVSYGYYIEVGELDYLLSDIWNIVYDYWPL